MYELSNEWIHLYYYLSIAINCIAFAVYVIKMFNISPPWGPAWCESAAVCARGEQSIDSSIRAESAAVYARGGAEHWLSNSSLQLLRVMELTQDKQINRLSNRTFQYNLQWLFILSYIIMLYKYVWVCLCNLNMI